MEHWYNRGDNLSTKHGLPWIVVYYLEHEEKTEVLKEEKRIRYNLCCIDKFYVEI